MISIKAQFDALAKVTTEKDAITMQRKWFGIALIALAIGLIGLYFYFQYRVPEGIEPMGDNTATIAWVSLATAIVSLLTAVISLFKSVIELRKT